MSDNLNNETNNTREEAARARRSKLSGGKVVEYAEVKLAAERAPEPGESEAVAAERAEMQVLLEKMEQYMSKIDSDPSSFDAVLEFGSAPVKKIGDIGKQMLEVQKRFSDQVNVMGDAIGMLTNGTLGEGMEKLGENAKKLLQGLAKVGVKGAKGVGGFLSSLFGKKKKTTDEEKLIKEMQEALPEMVKEKDRLLRMIEGTDKGLINVMDEATKLGKAQVDCMRELGLYIGATKEVLRRYKEEYVPEAQQGKEDSADPQAEEYYNKVVRMQERFLNRVASLEGSRANCMIQAQQIRAMINTMEDQREKNQDILRNNSNEWNAMLAAAGFAGSTLKAAQNAAEADAFGDKIFDSTQKMVETSHQMTLNGKSRGTVDPSKLIEGMDRIRQMIEKEGEATRERMRALDATAKQLRSETDKLIEAADESKQRRMLDAANMPGSESNDNSPAEPKKRNGTDNAPKND